MEAWEFAQPEWKKYLVRGAILAALFIPWMMGVRIVWGDTAWGPGFELKPFNRPEAEENQFGLAFGSGSAFPTPGIHRPIYGYFDNLFGGSLKNLELEISQENIRVVDTALAKNLPVLMTSWSPDFFLIDLYTRGYTTKDPAYNPSVIGKDNSERKFAKEGSQPVTIYYSEIIEDDGEIIAQKVREFETQYSQLILVGYPGTMRSLYLYCPSVFDPIGTTSAYVDMKKLAAGECGIK